jgi:Rrf2 family protein
MAKIVHISEAASLALHSMIIIAQSKKLINLSRIADMTGASKNHLAKISQVLVKKNFLKSTRGPSGGFVLKKLPEKITLLDIFECVEGEIEEVGCPSNKQICPFNKCLMDNIVQKVTKELKDYMKSQTLKDYIK